jgi:GTPase
MKPEIRIATIGNVDSAKSTTISVLANKILDNGRGEARKLILKHPHESNTGRTSSITQHFIETDQSIIGFVDLAGHEKYLKTTMTGLNGCFIDYCIVTIGADRGIIGMTKEHLSIAVALKIPLIIVITKIDIAKNHKLEKIKSNLNKLLSHKLLNNKKKIYVNNENIEKIDLNENIPIFEISNVTGYNISLLRNFIHNLPKNDKILNTINVNNNSIFKIDDRFKIKGIGIVLSGVVENGIISIGDKLYLGPFKDGTFKEVIIKNIHNNFRQNVNELRNGQGGCFNIKPVFKKKILDINSIKLGQILIKKPFSIKKFKAKVTILHHPTTIKINYQSVIHCGTVKQSAKICNMDKELIRTGDSAIVTFEFLFHPVYMQKNSKIIFREGKTKGIGKVLEIN